MSAVVLKTKPLGASFKMSTTELSSEGAAELTTTSTSSPTGYYRLIISTLPPSNTLVRMRNAFCMVSAPSQLC